MATCNNHFVEFRVHMTYLSAIHKLTWGSSTAAETQSFSVPARHGLECSALSLPCCRGDRGGNGSWPTALQGPGQPRTCRCTVTRPARSSTTCPEASGPMSPAPLAPAAPSSSLPMFSVRASPTPCCVPLSSHLRVGSDSYVFSIAGITRQGSRLLYSGTRTYTC